MPPWSEGNGAINLIIIGWIILWRVLDMFDDIHALMYSSVVYICYIILPWMVLSWFYCLLLYCCSTNVWSCRDNKLFWIWIWIWNISRHRIPAVYVGVYVKWTFIPHLLISVNNFRYQKIITDIGKSNYRYRKFEFPISVNNFRYR